MERRCSMMSGMGMPESYRTVRVARKLPNDFARCLVWHGLGLANRESRRDDDTAPLVPVCRTNILPGFSLLVRSFDVERSSPRYQPRCARIHLDPPRRCDHLGGRAGISAAFHHRTDHQLPLPDG